MPSFSPRSEASGRALTRMRPALGCYVRIQACGSDAGRLEAAITAAFEAIEAVERITSFHRPDSELHRLHRLGVGQTLPVDPTLWRALDFACGLWRDSDGLFDPAVAAALVAEGLLPRPEGLPAPNPQADLQALELPAPGMARLREPLWLDLGGLAKGQAVDAALAALRDGGASSGSVNAGGDLACFGVAETVGLRDPQDPARIAGQLQLRDGALASSGDYFRPGALRLPGAQRPAARRDSVAVLAADCLTADALTKPVWLAPQRALRLLERYDAAALVLDPGCHPRWIRSPNANGPSASPA